jgi:hypothetical protein
MYEWFAASLMSFSLAGAILDLPLFVHISLSQRRAGEFIALLS